MARAWRNDRYEEASVLQHFNHRRCLVEILVPRASKGAIIQPERRVALSQIGETAEAVAAFGKALRDAKAKPGPWELHQRMLQSEDHSAFALWVSVVNSAK